jgi:SAM-dependent methyltransferase
MESGLKSMNYKFNEKGNDYYDKNVKEAKKDRAQFSATLKARAKIISNLIEKHQLRGAFLDAGCGTGHILMTILKNHPKQFTSIEGTDFSSEACKNTAKLLDIKTQVGDLRDVSYLKKKYDSIVCSEVIEHIIEDEKVLRNLYQLLNTNGKLIITVPYLMSNWGKFDKISGHVRRYELGELENKLKQAGFKILESFGWGNLIYSIYFSLLLKNSNPHHAISELSHSNLKKNIYNLASDILTSIFLIDNLFKNKSGGKTLFVVAKK